MTRPPRGTMPPGHGKHVLSDKVETRQAAADRDVRGDVPRRLHLCRLLGPQAVARRLRLPALPFAKRLAA